MVRKKPTNMVEHGVVSAVSFIGIVWTSGENRKSTTLPDCHIPSSLCGNSTKLPGTLWDYHRLVGG